MWLLRTSVTRGHPMCSNNNRNIFVWRLTKLLNDSAALSLFAAASFRVAERPFIVQIVWSAGFVLFVFCGVFFFPLVPSPPPTLKHSFTLFGNVFKIYFFTCVCIYLKMCHAHFEYVLLITLQHVTARCFLYGSCGLMMNPTVSFHSSVYMCSFVSMWVQRWCGHNTVGSAFPGNE